MFVLHSFPGDPHLSSFEEVNDLPSPPEQLPGDPAPMASPGKGLGAEEGGSFLSSNLLQSLEPLLKGIAFHIARVSSFSKSPQLLSQIDIMNSYRCEACRKGLL